MTPEAWLARGVVVRSTCDCELCRKVRGLKPIAKRELEKRRVLKIKPREKKP